MIPPWGGPRGPWSPWGPIGLGPWNIPPRGGPRGPGPWGPSALAHRPWPIGPGPWSPWGPPGKFQKKKKPAFRKKQFSLKKVWLPPLFDHSMPPQEPSRKVYIPVFQPPGHCIDHLCSKYRFLWKGQFWKRSIFLFVLLFYFSNYSFYIFFIPFISFYLFYSLVLKLLFLSVLFFSYLLFFKIIYFFNFF